MGRENRPKTCFDPIHLTRFPTRLLFCQCDFVTDHCSCFLVFYFVKSHTIREGVP
jgi:hypothetical protein